MENSRLKRNFRTARRYWQYYVLLLPMLVLLVIFEYGPMYGLIIAFKDYNSFQGIMGSPWVGFKHFSNFFNYPYFSTMLWNTLRLSLMSVFLQFPLPIILALLINEVRFKRFRKTVQTITYLPYFVSVVVVVGIINTLLNLQGGMINSFFALFGKDPVDYLNSPGWFPWIYYLSSAWTGTGWAAIVYIGALSNVNPELHEAAIIDGAGRFKRMLHINIPSILPMISIMFILKWGSIMTVGMQKILLLQTPLNLETSDVIATYSYQVSFNAMYRQFSYGVAIGVFNSVVNLTLLLLSNFVSKRVGGESL